MVRFAVLMVAGLGLAGCDAAALAVNGLQGASSLYLTITEPPRDSRPAPAPSAATRPASIIPEPKPILDPYPERG